MDTKSNIYEKLAKFEKPEIVKDEAGYNYQYAGLGQIQEKLKAPLQKVNLHYLHRTENGKVITRVYCIDNPESYVESSIEIGECKSESVTTSYIFNKDKTEKEGTKVVTELATHDPQMQGSSITYYRRYNLLQIFDIEIDDDDGKSGSPKAKAQTQSKKGEPHTCTKCKTVNQNAEVFEGKFGPCFKCSSCGGYSKPNKVQSATSPHSEDYDGMPPF